MTVKIRYKSYEAAATLHPQSGGALIRFRDPQRAVTPGQAAVFYDGDILLGGGTIEPPEATSQSVFAVVSEWGSESSSA